MSVKDGGMMLVTALTPDLRWQSGAAELTLSVRGVKSQPQARAAAALSLPRHNPEQMDAERPLFHKLMALGGVRLNATPDQHVGREGNHVMVKLRS